MSVLTRKNMRRAVSPVIAVVLLIALSVAAAAVVWGVFDGFNNNDAQLIIESTDFTDPNDNKMSEQITFKLRNIGSEDAEISSVSFITSNLVYNGWVITSSEVLTPGSSGFLSVQTNDPAQELVSNNEVIVTITTSSNSILQEILAVPTQYFSSVIGEAGMVSVGGTEITVSLNNSYIDPVVVAVPVAASSATVRGGTDAAQTAVITDVTSNSFTIVQLGSQADTDGSTTTDVNYIVMEKGIHYVGTITIQVGTLTVSGIMTNYTYLENFTSIPTVIASTQTNTNAGIPHTRGNQVTDYNVQLMIENGDLNPSLPYTETVGYIAIESGFDLISGLQASTTGDSYTHSWKAIPFNNAYLDLPIVIAHLTNYDGPDEAYMAVSTVTNLNFEVSVEETTAHAPGNHTPETVSWMAIPVGSIVGS